MCNSTSAFPVLYYKDIEIESLTEQDGTCVTSTRTTTLSQAFIGQYSGNATETWAGSSTHSGPMPTGNLKYLASLLGSPSIRAGTYEGLPTVAIISEAVAAASCAFPAFV